MSPLAYYTEMVLIVLYAYVVKLGLAAFVKRKSLSVILYLLMILLVLPCVWINLGDWEEPNVAAITNWIGLPLVLFFIPTVTFILDVLSATEKSVRHLILRSIVEIAVLFTVWRYVFFTILLALDWVWL